MTFDATSGLSYAFDQENRITGAAGYTYTYDDGGNRVIKANGTSASSGTLYWYMTPGVVAESDLAGALKSEYVFFDGERVARKDFPGNTVAYYFSDHLKTASVITNASGTITSESDYYPWGGELQFINNDSNDYKFTGKKRDAETGLDYFGARYYSNGLGRWISADWSAMPVPVPYADLHDPQSLNLYGFVGGNPASRVDVDGHEDDQKSIWQKVGDVVRDILTSPSNGAPQLPSPSGCTCPGPQKQDNSKQNNNSKSENTGGEKSGSAKSGKETGSYTNTHESGKTYDGKGDRTRSQDSGKRIEKQTGR
jgi:RHS repeat-associated protein